jgi:hypothetical protein
MRRSFDRWTAALGSLALGTVLVSCSIFDQDECDNAGSSWCSGNKVYYCEPGETTMFGTENPNSVYVDYDCNDSGTVCWQGGPTEYVESWAYCSLWPLTCPGDDNWYCMGDIIVSCGGNTYPRFHEDCSLEGKVCFLPEGKIRPDCVFPDEP